MSATTQSVPELLRAARLIPVLTIERVDQVVPLARALVAGGVRTLEITLRTPAGADAAAAIQAEVPDAIVGLGTVVTRRDLELAKRLKLPFAFSPGATPELLDAAAELGVPFVPGVATASELIAAMARGFTTVKLFPAEQAGGIGTLKALAGPFPTARFNPTGGVSESNISAYLALPNVVAVGGSWLAPAADIAAGNWAAITERARRAMQSIGS
jgi:2-dehydro-3-deoxyphosphogluconate aldolase/(4S)-4-hydroxy-2-oxoglutarate aldolase